VYSALLIPRCIPRLPWLRFFRAFPSVVRQMPGYTSQRRGTVCTLPNGWTVLFCVLLVSIVLFYVLFVCKCVLYYCQGMVTQLQLNISYHIISYIISHHISYVVSCRLLSCHVMSCRIISYIIFLLAKIKTTSTLPVEAQAYLRCFIMTDWCWQSMPLSLHFRNHMDDL